MASWYSHIYVYVRGVRERHPICGYLLHLLLNIMLFAHLVAAVYSYYVYVFIVCGKMLTSALQISVYLVIYHTLIIMTFWSLMETLRTPISLVPVQYKVPSETDEQLKKATPQENGRYFPDRSTPEQIQQQHTILTSCSLLKPDRSHHCSSCGFCVVRFDHHCPWINKCVSHSNYKFFMLYITYEVALIVWSLLTSSEAVIRYIIHQQWKDELDEVLQIVICMIPHAIFGYYPLGELLIYHLQLIALNETTCEQAKIPIIRGDPQANYNFGCWSNYRTVYGWGLWLFPLNTSVTDGLHHPINYSQTADANEKLVVHEIPGTESTTTVLTTSAVTGTPPRGKSEVQVMSVN
ncbi:Palmitoyltransferase [Aphelenchoides besseyi]|nr:Palmitoyltransferase [Aphelenchoides besseyi]